MTAPLPTIEAGNSLFDQPWWLDATAPEAWSEVTATRDGRVVGRLPFVVRRRFGLTSLVQPPLTQSLGPWIATNDAKPARRLETEKKLLGELLEALPPFDVFAQNISPFFGNWLPFHWHGFTLTPRITYRLDDLTDLDAVWSGFEPDVRAQIRRAESRLAVRDDMPLDAFLALNRDALENKGVGTGYDDAFVRRLDAACSARASRLLLVAEDGSARVHAGAYFVWDERSAYYLMGGRSPEHTRGAPALLLWHAIRRAAEVTTAFDFEGSMIESVERYFRSFGARQVCYVQARKMGRRATAIKALLRRRS